MTPKAGAHLRRQAICEDCRLLAVIRLRQGNRHVVDQLQVWAAERRCDLEAAPNAGESRGILVNNADCTNALKDPATILFMSLNTCSDSIAKLFRACHFFGGGDLKQVSSDMLQNGILQIYLCK